VMMMYASRPIEFNDVIPRKSAIRDKTVRGMVALCDAFTLRMGVCGVRRNTYLNQVVESTANKGQELR
jgi:hypothetical protein